MKKAVSARKSQSSLEYIITLTAITIAVIIASVGPVSRAVHRMFGDAEGLLAREVSGNLNY